MKRRTRGRVPAVFAAALLSAVTGVACEDPIIIIGDLPGIMRRVAGMPNSIGTAVDSAAIRTQLHEPRGLAVAPDGTLYIADSRNARIIAVSPAGRTSVLAGAAGCTIDCLVAPWGLAMASDGSLWIADPAAHRIFRLEPSSGVLEVRAGTGERGDAADFTPALEAALNSPTGIAIGSSGLVYFSERGGHRVRWIQSQGSLRTIAGTGEAGFSGDGGAAVGARLNGPMGLSVAGTTLYIADEQNDRVRSVALAGGGIRTVAGNGVAGYADTDTIAVAAKLARPRALAATQDGGRLFIADAMNHRVRLVNLATGRITGFGGTGSPIFTDEGLDAGDTSLSEPGGLALYRDGTLFIADTGHQIVWRTPIRF